MRVVENLNLALHGVLADDPAVHLLGEDVLDPYGGAFKVTKGLSSRFPDRVLTTPLSEGGIVGVAAGLALAGDKAIVEMMFADFAALAFDQIVNFLSKSVSMYGRPVPMPVVVRCPHGGRRGYGPTHSQSPHKHFLGVPGLALYEITPFHDNRGLLDALLARGEPAMLFEDKVLYTRQMYENGTVDELVRYDSIGPGIARAFIDDPDTPGPVLIAPGGLAHRAIAAMRALLVEDELSTVLLVPTRLYPLDVEPMLETLRDATAIVVAEDGTAGGTWGAEVAAQVHARLWGELRRPVRLVHAPASVIPTAPHLEREVLVQDATIRRAVLEALR